jgi:hypothetical protein
MTAPTPAPKPAEAKRTWVEPVVAILMAVSTLGTAWCSYQSARWTAVSGRHVRSAEGSQRRAMALHLEGNQVTAVQGQMFMQWVNAHLAGNEQLAQFYSARFGPELDKAFAAWLAQKPFENAQAPPHPITPELYQPRFSVEGKQALEESARQSELAISGTQTAARYLSNTVLFATVLFFAGMSGKFEQRRVRAGTMFFAIAVFLFTAFRLLNLPVARGALGIG